MRIDSTLPTTLILASHNQGKCREFQQLLAPKGITVRSARAFDLPDVEETGLTFVENALIKARHVARLTGKPALADDSGLCVDALQGQPGIYSARFSEEQTDAANNAKLLECLKNTETAERTAFFYCALVLLRHPEDPTPIIAEGKWHGRILTAPKGDNGFGYDPLFHVPSENKTSAELTPETKNRLSHRGRAMQSLLAALASPPC